jgi:hypothetical protein
MRPCRIAKTSQLAIAVLVLKSLAQGHVVATFDRQAMCNGGPGYNINKRDNREMLHRLINFLSLHPGINSGPNSSTLSFPRLSI